MDAALVEAGLRRREDGEVRRDLLHVARLPGAARRRSGSARCSRSRAIATCVCHASAWDMDGKDDVRIKMCITPDRRGPAHHLPRAGPRLLLPLRTRTSRSCSRTAPTTASTRPSATRSTLSMTPAYLAKIGLVPATKPSQRGADQPADEDGAREDRLPAVRQADRRVALGGVLRARSRPRTTTSLVGAARAVPGRRRRRSRAARTTSIRARSTTCRATRPTRATSCRSSSQFQFHRALCEAAGFKGPLYRVLDLRQQGGRREAPRDARAGRAASRGRTRWTSSPARARWMPRRSSSTSRRCAAG